MAATTLHLPHTRPLHAGVIFIGGFVGRGVELRALQQAAWQLRLAVGGRVPTAVA